MAFKIALNAGHGLYTAGKRCMRSIDPKQTREWVLNSRIVEKIEAILADYDIEVLRLDDRTGKKDISLTKRANTANNWGADFYFSAHHNAGINGGSGGGIVAFVHTSPSAEAVEWQKAFYNAAIKATGLKGNRATPIARKNLAELRLSKMPAVLMECGFMDSTVDVPVILSEDYAEKIARAFADVIIEKSGAKKKTVTATTEKNSDTVYTVKSGDTLGEIAQKFGVTVAELKAYNSIENANVIYVGQRIRIPVAKWTPAVGDTVRYNGAVHYTTANAATARACKGGIAKIQRIYKLGKSKHPYQLKRVNGKGATVNGWVNENTFTKA